MLMNLAPPESKGNTIEELRTKLNEFVNQSSITNFEADDIVQLIEEGESIDWIVNQLKSNSPNIDSEAIATLLTDIEVMVGPPVKASKYSEAAPEGSAEASASAVLTEMPDLSQMDLSQLDLSQLVDSLPPDVKLPPGMDVKQLKSLMASPQGKIMGDFFLFCTEKGIDLNERTLNDPRTQRLRDEWNSTPRDAFDGKTPAEMLNNDPGLMPAKIETYRREEPRVGRNDPCPCGSGKKYKKCCGRI
jgi:hypothetical protein